MISTYISPDAPIKEDIQEYLLRNALIDKRRILNLSDAKRYVSCGSLERVAIVVSGAINICCDLPGIRNSAPYVIWKDNARETVKDFIQYREQIIDAVQKGKEGTPCSNCPDLCMGAWDRDRRIRVLALSLCYPCQLSCIYCDLPTNAKYINEENNREYAKIAERTDVEELVRAALEEEGRLQPSCPIDISGGEITLSPHKERLLRAVEKYPLQIFTNAIIFDEQIAELASRAGSYLNVSIDSGTRESYKTVKGLDVFAEVCENLRKYREWGSNLLLKYIILPENNNEADFNGFISLCKELDPISVSVSCNLHINTLELPKEIVEGAVSMARKLRKIGIHADVLSLYGKDNLQYIHQKLREQNE